MAKHKRKAKLPSTTRDMVDDIDRVHAMSEKRARFVLIALLSADAIEPHAFRQACLMADVPCPIEQEVVVQDQPPPCVAGALAR